MRDSVVNVFGINSELHGQDTVVSRDCSNSRFAALVILVSTSLVSGLEVNIAILVSFPIGCRRIEPVVSNELWAEACGLVSISSNFTFVNEVFCGLESIYIVLLNECSFDSGIAEYPTVWLVNERGEVLSDVAIEEVHILFHDGQTLVELLNLSLVKFNLIIKDLHCILERLDGNALCCNNDVQAVDTSVGGLHFSLKLSDVSLVCRDTIFMICSNCCKRVDACLKTLLGKSQFVFEYTECFSEHAVALDALAVVIVDEVLESSHLQTKVLNSYFVCIDSLSVLSELLPQFAIFNLQVDDILIDTCQTAKDVSQLRNDNLGNALLDISNLLCVVAVCLLQSSNGIFEFSLVSFLVEEVEHLFEACVSNVDSGIEVADSLVEGVDVNFTIHSIPKLIGFLLDEREGVSACSLSSSHSCGSVSLSLESVSLSLSGLCLCVEGFSESLVATSLSCASLDQSLIGCSLSSSCLFASCIGSLLSACAVSHAGLMCCLNGCNLVLQC